MIRPSVQRLIFKAKNNARIRSFQDAKPKAPSTILQFQHGFLLSYFPRNEAVVPERISSLRSSRANRGRKRRNIQLFCDKLRQMLLGIERTVITNGSRSEA